MASMETWNQKTAAGLAVVTDQSACRKRVVGKVAKRIGRSERYVWESVKYGAKMAPRMLATLEEETR
jgi:hypothetical protein